MRSSGLCMACVPCLLSLADTSTLQRTAVLSRGFRELLSCNFRGAVTAVTVTVQAALTLEDTLHPLTCTSHVTPLARGPEGEQDSEENTDSPRHGVCR